MNLREKLQKRFLVLLTLFALCLPLSANAGGGKHFVLNLVGTGLRLFGQLLFHGLHQVRLPLLILLCPSAQTYNTGNR